MRKIIILTLGLSIFPGICQGQSFKVGIGIFQGAVVADTGTTLIALKNPNNYEANPIWANVTNHKKTFTALSVGTGILSGWALKKLHKTNPRLAWAILITVTAARGYAIQNNIRRIK